MLPHISLALVLVLSTPSWAASDLCPLLGPDYPAPACLRSSSAFKKATTAFEEQLAKIAGASNSTGATWSVSISSAASNETLYERHFTSDLIKNSTVGVKKIDSDSVYRVGSISKVFTVYTFLAGLGDAHFNDPISKYVPEMRNVKKIPQPKNATYDDINNVDWDDVTIGNLASHLSGLERDLTVDDLSVSLSPDMLKAAGLPVVNGIDVPTCGANPDQKPCSRKDFFPLLFARHPAFPTSHSPAYSNLGFELLQYAFENTKKEKKFGKAMDDLIFKPLGMKGSSFNTPKSDTNAVIPGGNKSLTMWDFDIGIDSASGAVYSSTQDMISVTHSILSSSILTKAQTRRWLRPVTNTADEDSYVGAPWEIRRFPLANGRTTDLYAKQGDIGLYNSELILSPDHKIAITVMAAGPGGPQVRTDLAAALANTIIPGVEAAARDEAKDNYAGIYKDESTNSSVTIAIDDKIGLRVDDLISRGVPTLKAIIQSPDVKDRLQPRLYPTTLKTIHKKTHSDGTYTSRTGWRMVIIPPEAKIATDDKYTTPCLAWVAVAAQQFGNVAIDDTVFTLGEDGKATALDLRGLRLHLKKQK